jgi:hypothetical protein
MGSPVRVYYAPNGKRYHTAHSRCLRGPRFHVDTIGKGQGTITIAVGRTLTACKVCVTKEWQPSGAMPPMRFGKGQTFHGGAETFRG